MGHLKKIFTSAIVATALLANAQTNYQFKYFSSKDGLVPNSVTDLVQDSLGFIWFNATTHLIRFDGYNFKAYAHNPDDSSSFPGNEHTKLLIDQEGKLWINSNGPRWGYGSLLQYDYTKDGFKRHKHSLGYPGAHYICFDKNKTQIWLGGNNDNYEGLYSYDMKAGTTTQYVNFHKDSTTHTLRNSILGFQDHDSVLLVGTRAGLWMFDKNRHSFMRPPVAPEDSTFLFNTWLYILRPDESNKWLRSSGILYRLDSQFRPVEMFPANPQRSTILADGFDEDAEGNIWSANWQGLHHFNRLTQEFSIVSDGPASAMVNVRIDRNNNIWAISAGVAMIKKMIGETLKNFGSSSAFATATIINNKTGASAIVGGYTGDLYQVNLNKDELSFSTINYKGREEITGEFKQGRLGKKYYWSAIWLHGIMGIQHDANGLNPAKTIFLDHDPNNPYTIVGPDGTDVWEDSLGNLWYSSWRGLSKINLNVTYGTEGSVIRYVHNPSDSNSLSDNQIFGLFPDDNNSFWVATAKGLDFFVDGKFYRQRKYSSERTYGLLKSSQGVYYIGTPSGYLVGTKEGNQLNLKKTYLSEVVFSFSEDGLGRIWMAVSSGVLIYDPSSGITTKLGESDGIIENPQKIERTENGWMVITGPKGISRIRESDIKKSAQQVFPALTKILVNNKVPAVGSINAGSTSDFHIPFEASVLSELTLDYLHNNFSLEFSAMEMTAPEKNLYRHKLEGYDKDWIETDYKNRTATYTNLPAATYTFRVKASNHQGVWSEKERTLKVIILPPPWRTWWAYTGYLMLVAGGLVLARKNIVQRERLKSNLQLAKVEQEKEHIELEKAQEVDRVKTSFFTNISHEFRTPLTLIKGPVQNIIEEFVSGQKEIDKQKVVEQLKLVQRNSDHLLKLINQLLDLARLESGSLKIEKSEGDLYSFIRAIASSFESFARQKNVNIEIDVPSLNQPALFDKDKLETILINLVNNAIKFTPARGAISVTAEVISEQPLMNNQRLVLRVKDTGIGIPEEHQNKIFERFHQVSEAHKEVGTGIGLSLVKELINLMGGSISVKSEVGKGSEFKVVLPVEIIPVIDEKSESTVSLRPSKTDTTLSETDAQDFDNLTTNNQQPTTKNDQDSTKPHVLVVEDNNDLRAFIIDSLGGEFYFLEAENGRIGLEVAIKEIPDLIISDVMMPEMDGITMATKIKKDIRTSHIPLILLTAKSTEDSKLSGLQSGADDYLTKPFNKNELLLKVRNGVNRQIKLREKLRAELMSTAPKVEVLSEDEQFLNSVKEKILERLSDEQLSVESLAEDMGMSRVQLYRKISGLTDISVNELIRKLRLQRAAQLLQQNWGPVSQVAYEVGFSNLSYFSKVFKEEFGVLPSEYSEKA